MERGRGLRLSGYIPLRLCAFVLLLTFAPFRPATGSEADQVLVVFNRREHGSEEIARHYVTRRGIPEDQVLGLRLSVSETISRKEFVEELQTPIAAFLEDNAFWVRGTVPLRGMDGIAQGTRRGIVASRIRYLVLCRGVPLKISGDPTLKDAGAEDLRPEFQRNEAAVDSELTCLPLLQEEFMLAGPINNPCYGVTNAAMLHPTNGVLMVARLDGPTIKIAKNLVDKAMDAETNGFWGRAYVDLRNPIEPGMKLGEDWLRSAAEICRVLGFETVVDEDPATFRRGFPMSQIGVYAGWYSENADGPFLDEPVEFMPGALAYHLHSFSAASLRTPTRYWVAPLLQKGATLSLGCVYEPYLSGTPDIAVLVSRLYHMDFNYGEAACASQGVISWMTTVVGDPLYKPLLLSPQEMHTQLVENGNPLPEWSHLRIVNLNLARGFSKNQAVTYLEQIPATKKSAVLTEKLADLYAELGKPSSALRSWQAALDLKPSPKQRIRLQRELGEKLTGAGRNEEAIAAYEQILEQNPHYSDAVSVYRKLAALSEKVGNSTQTLRFQEEIKKRTGS